MLDWALTYIKNLAKLKCDWQCHGCQFRPMNIPMGSRKRKKKEKKTSRDQEKTRRDQGIKGERYSAWPARVRARSLPCYVCRAEYEKIVSPSVESQVFKHTEKPVIRLLFPHVPWLPVGMTRWQKTKRACFSTEETVTASPEFGLNTGLVCFFNRPPPPRSHLWTVRDVCVGGGGRVL